MVALPLVSVQSGGEFHRGIFLCVSLCLLCASLCNALRRWHIAAMVFSNHALDASLLLESLVEEGDDVSKRLIEPWMEKPERMRCIRDCMNF